jgi:hypothetical protein
LGIPATAISLFVIGKTLRYRSWAAVAKGGTMGVVGFVALAANAACFGLLWAYRRAGRGAPDK